MTTLRCILGAIAVLCGGGIALPAVLGKAFCKSSRATEHVPLFITWPVTGPPWILGGVRFPSSKPLLPAAALAGVGLVGLCPWHVFRNGAVPPWFPIAYLVA